METITLLQAKLERNYAWFAKIRIVILAVWIGLILFAPTKEINADNEVIKNNSASEQTKTVTYSCTIPLTRLDWDTRNTTHTKANVSRPRQCILVKFDTKLGTLESIEFIVTQSTEGTIGIENTVSVPLSVVADNGSNVRIFLPDQTGNSSITSDLLSLPVSSSSTFWLDRYDNQLDYEGKSGQTMTLTSKSNEAAVTLTDRTIIQQFISSSPLIEIYPIDIQAVEQTALRSTPDNTIAIDRFSALSTRAQVRVVYRYIPNYSFSELNNEQQSANPSTIKSLTRSGGGTRLLLPLVVFAGYAFILVTGLVLSIFPAPRFEE